MKKTLVFSMLAATVMGGLLLTLPAEAYGCHHHWRHSHYVTNYNYGYNYNPYFTSYQTVPVWQSLRTGWVR